MQFCYLTLGPNGWKGVSAGKLEETRGRSVGWGRGALLRRADERRREDENRGRVVLPHGFGVDVDGGRGERGGDAGVALVERDGRRAAGVGRGVSVQVIGGLEGVAMLAGRAEVQVVGLALGEVVVEGGSCQRREASPRPR